MSFLKPNVKNNSYKWEILFFLWVAFFLNQADRQIFNVLLTSIQADLSLTDSQMGLIATAFNFAFALLVPISGLLGDRLSKRWILVASILLWSSSTMMTGLSTTMLMFIAFRSVATGVGEAMFGPAYVSTIAAYHKGTRALAMSIHQTSYYVGIVASSILATYISGLFGWRMAFVIFGSAGIFWGVLMAIRMRDKAYKNSAKQTLPQSAISSTIENPADAPIDDKGVLKAVRESSKQNLSVWESVKILFSVPTAVILTIGFSGLIFVLTGYLTWMPAYLEVSIGMSKESAAFNATLYTHLAAFFGIIIAGRMSDKLAKIKHSYRILMQSAGLMLAVPFIVMMGMCTNYLYIFIGLAGFGFLRAFFDANTHSVLYDVIPEKHRASASGIMLMIGFGVGSLAGWILGVLKPLIGLSMGITLLAAVWVPCSILLFLAYKFTYQRDYEKASAIDAADENRLDD